MQKLYKKSDFQGKALYLIESLHLNHYSKTIKYQFDDFVSLLREKTREILIRRRSPRTNENLANIIVCPFTPRLFLNLFLVAALFSK